jgi:hypothetical protein
MAFPREDTVRTVDEHMKKAVVEIQEKSSSKSSNRWKIFLLVTEPVLNNPPKQRGDERRIVWVNLKTLVEENLNLRRENEQLREKIALAKSPPVEKTSLNSSGKMDQQALPLPSYLPKPVIQQLEVLKISEKVSDKILQYVVRLLYAIAEVSSSELPIPSLTPTGSDGISINWKNEQITLKLDTSEVATVTYTTRETKDFQYPNELNESASYIVRWLSQHKPELEELKELYREFQEQQQLSPDQIEMMVKEDEAEAQVMAPHWDAAKEEWEKMLNDTRKKF